MLETAKAKKPEDGLARSKTAMEQAVWLILRKQNQKCASIFEKSDNYVDDTEKDN